MKHYDEATFSEEIISVRSLQRVGARPPKKTRQKECLREGCSTIFQYLRSNAKYCSGMCRQIVCRPRQNSFDSPTKRRTNMEYWDRALLGYHNLMSQMPWARSQWLQDYIDTPTSQYILCNPQLLASDSNNLAKIANRFTQQVYRVSIKTYVDEIRDCPDKILKLYDYSVFEEPLNELIIRSR